MSLLASDAPLHKVTPTAAWETQILLLGQIFLDPLDVLLSHGFVWFLVVVKWAWRRQFHIFSTLTQAGLDQPTDVSDAFAVWEVLPELIGSQTWLVLRAAIINQAFFGLLLQFDYMFSVSLRRFFLVSILLGYNVGAWLPEVGGKRLPIFVVFILIIHCCYIILSFR